MSTLGLDVANKEQGFGVIPASTQVTLVMKIKPGNTGIEGLLTRSSKGDAEMLNVEFTVLGGPYDKRKIFANLLLDGTTSGHAEAGKISRAMLRAIFEATHAINPDDNSPATITRRANAMLAGFNGATFLAELDIEKGGRRPDGSGFYKDKNVIGKVFRPGDKGYLKLDQPPPAPIERSSPPHSHPPAGATAPNAPPTPAAAAVIAIAKPSWAQ